MKKFKHLGLAVIGAILVVTLTGYTPPCPAVDPLDHTVFLPHEDDCEAFYMCSNGVGILQKCHAGMHFNERLGVCDWPANANCTPKWLKGYKTGTVTHENITMTCCVTSVATDACDVGTLGC